MPMWPGCGTRKMVCLSVAPLNFSGCCGPGTLATTATAFLAKRSSSASRAGWIAERVADDPGNAGEQRVVHAAARRPASGLDHGERQRLLLKWCSVRNGSQAPTA